MVAEGTLHEGVALGPGREAGLSPVAHPNAHRLRLPPVQGGERRAHERGMPLVLMNTRV